MHNAGIIYLCYGCIALTFFFFTKDSAHAFNKKIRKLALKIKKFHGDNLSKKKNPSKIEVFIPRLEKCAL